MSKPKLLLITPPYHCGVVEVAGRWLPLNLLYIAQAARAAGVEPVLYDAMSLDVGWDEIRAEIRRRRPAYVASYSITATINKCLELGQVVREEMPDALYILGGVHPTFMWKELLEEENSPVDIVVCGEGERTTEEMFRALLKDGDLSKVAGLAYRDGQGEVQKTRRPLL